jgi:hypothetical protein
MGLLPFISCYEEPFQTAAGTVISNSSRWPARPSGKATNSGVATKECSDGVCTVFITSETFRGDLGGLAGADAKCQVLAQAAGLGGTYKAWLSNGIASPSRRFTRASVPYVLVDGTKIALHWRDLTDGALSHPINVTERKSRPDAYGTWSATQSDGSPLVKAHHCKGWTMGTRSDTPASSEQGGTGTAGKDDRAWSENRLEDCAQAFPLYCFEQ